MFGGALAGVVDECHSEVESSGEFAQGGEDGGNFGGVVFIHALKPHIRVQYQKRGTVPGEGFAKPSQVVGSIEPKGRLKDKTHIEGVEVRSAGSSQTFDALAHLLGSILSSIDEHSAGLSHVEAIQTRSARSHRYGDFQCEPGLARFGCASNDPDRTMSPQLLDEPRGLFECAWR
jgi:hypothetical protein